MWNLPLRLLRSLIRLTEATFTCAGCHEVLYGREKANLRPEADNREAGEDAEVSALHAAW